jgi:hypothetical protein
MAFTKAPMENTEKNTTLPLLWEWDDRSPLLDKDTEAVNVVWDVVQDKIEGSGHIHAIKREGLQQFNTVAIGAGIDGLFYWAEPQIIVGAGSAGIQFFSNNGVNTNTNALVAFDIGIAGHIGFTNFLYDDGHSDLVITDGFNAVVVTTACAVTIISDADRPVFHRPYPVFLDGYLFLADDKSNIQNSVNNNPLSWVAGDFISAEAYPDKITALARHGAYIVAFGTSSMEFFYDAANPTGTPLAKYTASTPRIGYLGGLAPQGDSLYFIGTPVGSYPGICKLTGFKIEQIGTASSNRSTAYAARYPFGLLQSDFAGHIFNINGHTLYCWRSNNSKTYAVDTDTGMFTRLETHLSNSVGFNPVASCFVERPVNNGDAGFTVVSFSSFNSNLFAFSPTIYRDDNVNFTVTFVTRNLDFGTRRRKFGNRLVIACDQPATPSNISISWTDNDYQTYSTARTLDISNVYPAMYSLGMFMKRAWKITYSDNFPLRFQSMELDYQQGDA